MQYENSRIANLSRSMACSKNMQEWLIYGIAIPSMAMLGNFGTSIQTWIPEDFSKDPTADFSLWWPDLLYQADTKLTPPKSMVPRPKRTQQTQPEIFRKRTDHRCPE